MLLLARTRVAKGKLLRVLKRKFFGRQPTLAGIVHIAEPGLHVLT